MKYVALLHNPTAGDEKHYSEKLIQLIEKEGYECRYSSTKENGWHKIKQDTDLIVIAGGDGSIRKVLLKLLEKEERIPCPAAILPLGTANNIARTWGVKGDVETIIRSWKKGKIRHFDVCRCTTDQEEWLFIESFGYGLFPRLMHDMKEAEKKDQSPEEELEAGKEMLFQKTQTSGSRECLIAVDGKEFSGDYLMVEVMNIRSIGPNLLLAPDADPGDGIVELIGVPVLERTALADYVKMMIASPTHKFPFKSIKGKEIEITWGGKMVHVDDKLVALPPRTRVKIKVLSGLISIVTND